MFVPCGEPCKSYSHPYSHEVVTQVDSDTSGTDTPTSWRVLGWHDKILNLTVYIFRKKKLQIFLGFNYSFVLE